MKFNFELTISCSAKRVWSFYEDIQKWYTWEDELQDIQLEGSFSQGSAGNMTFTGMPPLAFELISVIKEQKFCDKTSIPEIGDLYFDHQIKTCDGGVLVQHSVALENAEISKQNIAFLNNIFKDVPHSMLKLKEVCENV